LSRHLKWVYQAMGGNYGNGAANAGIAGGAKLSRENPRFLQSGAVVPAQHLAYAQARLRMRG